MKPEKKGAVHFGKGYYFFCGNHEFFSFLILVSEVSWVDLGSTPHPLTVANKGLEDFPTKNVILLVVTSIL